MRLLVRRLSWLVPTVVLVTLVTFGVLSVALPVTDGGPRLPLFFNPDPGAVEKLARAAVERLGKGPDAGAAREVAELGGAALPVILPALDSLDPEGRARVVAGLRPVGARMGFELDERLAPSREVLFWTRFWEEHSIDYRPLVARRAVLRLVRRSTELRDAEVQKLDTYALDELITQMPPVHTAADVDRVRRLAAVAAGLVAEPGARVPPGATVEEARRVASAWQDWWSRHRTRYKTYNGTERITAMLRDTRYGSWVIQAVRHRLGLMADGRAAWDVLGQGARVSLPLLGCGVAGALLWAVLGGLLAVREEALWRRSWHAALILRAALPLAVIAAWLARGQAASSSPSWLAGLLLACFGVPASGFSRHSGEDAEREALVRTLRAFGASRWRARLSSLRLSSARMVAQLGATLSYLLTLTFVVECVLGLPGLGKTTVTALVHPDLQWLMAITICTALFVGLLSIVSELALGWLDPRTGGPEGRERGLG